MSNQSNLPMAVYESLKSQMTYTAKPRITTPEDILLIKSAAAMSKLKVEHFNIITLDSAARVIKFHNVTKGLLNHSLIHNREIFRAAIKDNAHSIIALHNHPSGSLDPSSQDIEVTKQINNAGEIIGIKLLDHIIITTTGISSMRQLGYV